MSDQSVPRSAILSVGVRVYIHKPRSADAREFLDLVRASRKFHRPWVSPPGDIEGYASYIRATRSTRFVGTFARLCDGNALVGVVNLSEIVRGSFQSAYMGFYGHASFVGAGYMTEALRLVIGYSFRELRLHRLEANIQPGNARSIALVGRCGFRKEGHSPRYLKIAGMWRDHERWAILRDVWRAESRNLRHGA